MDRNEIVRKFNEIEWPYAPYDHEARKQMAERIARTGRLGANLISYSNLVAGIAFNLPNVNGGKPFEIDTHNWRGLDRRIVGDFLGYISSVSYKEAGFMATSLVVSLEENQPSYIFFEWMKDLGILENLSEKAIEKFWVGEVTKAVAWYKKNPKGFEV